MNFLKEDGSVFFVQLSPRFKFQLVHLLLSQSKRYAISCERLRRSLIESWSRNDVVMNMRHCLRILLVADYIEGGMFQSLSQCVGYFRDGDADSSSEFFWQL